MPKKKPLLSIITINLNNHEKLENTILSVLTQPGITATNFEYIIIDGGSSDNSIDIIKKYVLSKKYGKFISYWCSEKDDGIYAALNKGIVHANGSLIGLINSGDSYLPNVFMDILDTHKKNPDTILYAALKTTKNGEFQKILGYNHNYLRQYMIPHPSTFVPKCIYDKYGIFNETYKIAGDYELFLRFYTNNVNFKFIDKIICNFDLDGISNTQLENSHIEADKVRKKYGFYVPPTKKQIIQQFIKKIIKKIKFN